MTRYTPKPHNDSSWGIWDNLRNEWVTCLDGTLWTHDEQGADLAAETGNWLEQKRAAYPAFSVGVIDDPALFSKRE